MLGDLLSSFIKRRIGIAPQGRAAGLDQLPEAYRSVVYLVLVREFSYREAAEVLEIPVGTVMSRLHRGRRALQAQLLEYARDAQIPAMEGNAGAAE